MTYPPPPEPDDRSGPSLRKETPNPDQSSGDARGQQPGQDPGYGQQPYAAPEYGQQYQYGAPQFGQQPQYGTPQYGTPQYGTPSYVTPYGVPLGSQTNGKAIGALVCGIAAFLTCLLFVGIPAVILANMAIADIDASNGQQDGRGMAVAGRILGWIATALTIIVLAVILIVLVLAAANS